MTGRGEPPIPGTSNRITSISGRQLKPDAARLLGMLCEPGFPARVASPRVGVGGHADRPAGAAVLPPWRRAGPGYRRPLVGAGLAARGGVTSTAMFDAVGWVEAAEPTSCGHSGHCWVGVGSSVCRRRAARAAAAGLAGQSGGHHRGPRRAGAPGRRAARRRDRPRRRARNAPPPAPACTR